MISFDCEGQDRPLMILLLQSITYFSSKVAGQTKILYVAYELMVIHFMVSQYVSYKVVVGDGGVYVASIFILRNPDTLLPHLYSCLAIRYTTIPYQKSAQPPWIPRKVILVMLPPWRLSLSLSLSLISSLSYCILCSISSLERAQLGWVREVSPFYWEFLWHVIWHETKITFLLWIVF